METVVQLADVREEKRRRRERMRRAWRRSVYRLLWSKLIHMAWHPFRCDYCIAPIEPGDSYEREVHANYYGIWVKRRHYPNCYGPTEEDVLEEMERAEEERQEEEQLEQAAMGNVA